MCTISPFRNEYQQLGCSLIAQTVKNLPGMQEAWVQTLGRDDLLKKELATPLEYSCLENSNDRGAWWATVHRVARVRHN